jgi:hypothetical protein
MKTMISKFNGHCASCGGSIRKGEQIHWSKATGAVHASCATAQSEVSSDGSDDDERSWPPSRAVLEADKRSGLVVVRFSSGAVITQNRRGRCIDAPCCGCCS